MPHSGYLLGAALWLGTVLLQATGQESLRQASAPSTEWTYHKSADGSHPDGNEQQMMWLMNRARANPPQEGFWLATMTDPEVVFWRNYLGVNLNVLQNEFNSYPAKPPAAFDVRLYNAAKVHSDDLIARNAADHEGQLAAVDASGFLYWRFGGNVFAYAQSALQAHGAFNIDFGMGYPDGMIPGRGHRLNIMSLTFPGYDFTNAGIAVVQDTNPGATIGPLVVTENFCNAMASANEYNVFIVGTVWRDTNSNGRYDPGEGIAGERVTPSQGTFFAVTSNSGGYAIPITASGSYQITFSGPFSATRNVTVGSASVLLDFNVEQADKRLFLPVTRKS